ncbi:MAG: CHRD domain-containing protein, partial [Burkholderiaceae bacterium]
MIRFQHAALGAAIAGALLLGACGTSPGPSGSFSRMTSLSGSAEVPPVSTPATGTAETSYNRDTKVLRWTVSYANLSGPATGGHFHGPAMPGSNAP